MSIQVTQLTKIYGTQHAVDGISFELKKGEIVGFLGPNGAGKSTTMKMISGYLEPTAGSILVGGMNVAENPIEIRKKIGYLPESNPLYFDMYVREYLLFAASLHQIAKHKIKDKVEEVIALTGLQKECHKKIGALSKGYKQRVGLAQAIIHDPEVLILDEPTSGLDPNQLVEIRELIVSLGKEKTVLLSTHIMQEVASMCNSAIVISNGKIVANDTIANLQKLHTDNTLEVVFEKPVTIKQLSSLTNEKSIQAVSETTYLFTTNDSDALRKKIMQWSIQEDINIAAMQVASSSLESVFRKLTT
jgi:ABC-2 type transport system ATP-binding protein